MTIANAAPEFGAKFTLTGSDGTIAVFNDSTDANYVGMLSEETSGLDSAEVREDAADLVQGDGGVHGDFFSGRRPIVLAGDIDGSAVSAAVRNERIARLQQAAMNFRADAKLTWTPQGGTARTLETLRRNQPLRISGSYHKKFFVPLVAADPRIYGPTTTLEKTYTEPSGSSTESAKTATVVTDFGSGTAWTNPNNAKVSDNVYAVASLAGGAASHSLAFSSFGFAIPAGALVIGIKVAVERRGSGGTSIVQTVSTLTKVAGNPVGSDLTGESVGWATGADETFNYGSSSNVWGTSWTPAEINSTGFGYVMRAENNGSIGEAKLDSVTITVNYIAGGEFHAETITNNGNTTTYPKFKVTGKTLGSITIQNGNEWVWSIVKELVNNTHNLEVDFFKKTILLDGVDASKYMTFPIGWGGLHAGANFMGLPASSKVVVTYRDAWL